MMKKLFFLFLITSGFQLLSFNEKSQLSEGHQLVLDLFENTSQKLGEKYDIHYIGNTIDGQYGYLEIDFTVYRKLSKEEARHMLIECLEEFLSDINNNTKLKPHLKNHPFTTKNVGIVFYISDTNGDKLFHPEICVARYSSKDLEFITNDPDQKYKYKEHYEETLDIVKKANSSEKLQVLIKLR